MELLALIVFVAGVVAIVVSLHRVTRAIYDTSWNLGIYANRIIADARDIPGERF